MPALLPPAVRALLQHYARVARDDPRVRARVRGTWLVGEHGELSPLLGVANRSAHQLLARHTASTARRWRAEWLIHGLLRPNGREAFTGCMLLPLIAAHEGRLALAALPLTALADPRTLSVRTTGPGWLDLATDVRGPGAVLYACSDPFDALVLRGVGLPALALVAEDHTPVPAWRGLITRLMRLRPRRLCLTCATTTRGERIAEHWRDVAALAGIPVDACMLPSGCTLRDVAHIARGEAAATLRALVDRRVAPRPATAVSARPPRHEALRRGDPWHKTRTPLAADLSAYLDALHVGGRSRDERQRTAVALARFWRHGVSLGLTRTSGLQRRHLEGFQAALTDAACGLSVGARARTLAALRGFLRWAVVTGRSVRELATALTPVRRPRPIPPRVLGVRDIERTLAAIPHRRPVGLRDRAMLEVLYATGIRRGELVGLEVVDVDASAATLRVRRGKGGTTRIVPLTRRAVAWVQRYLEQARPLHVADLAEPALFVTRRGKRLTPKQVTGRMHACWVAAGLATAGSCHVVRHSVATPMHDRGADIRDLQALLGHALLTSTQLYTRVSMQRLHEVHRRTHPGAGDEAGTMPPP